MIRIRFWPLRHDDHSVVLIGQHACWLVTLARESIDSPPAKSNRLQVCRGKWQLAATMGVGTMMVKSMVLPSDNITCGVNEKNLVASP